MEATSCRLSSKPPLRWELIPVLFFCLLLVDHSQAIQGAAQHSGDDDSSVYSTALNHMSSVRRDCSRVVQVIVAWNLLGGTFGSLELRRLWTIKLSRMPISRLIRREMRALWMPLAWAVQLLCRFVSRRSVLFQKSVSDFVCQAFKLFTGGGSSSSAGGGSSQLVSLAMGEAVKRMFPTLETAIDQRD